jgi:hypothetical protein
MSKVFKPLKRNIVVDKMRKKSFVKISAGLVFMLFAMGLFQFVLAADNPSVIVSSKNASNCIKESNVLLQDLVSKNFSTNRVNDTLNQATVLYGAQIVLEEKKQKTDFSLVTIKCDEIKIVYDMAVANRDAVSSLKIFYKESLTPEMNTSSVDETLSSIDFEMTSERYEKVQPLIDQAYQEIIDIKAKSTALSLFYESTTRGIKNFIIRNWIRILIVLVVLIILFAIFRVQIGAWWIKQKIKALNLRKQTIKKLMMKAQQGYFQTGSISETDYQIRIKNWAELIRDIDRQVPMLYEELSRLTKTSIKEIPK